MLMEYILAVPGSEHTCEKGENQRYDIIFHEMDTSGHGKMEQMKVNHQLNSV